ncbi:unnamed protein product [Brucella canis str. Oliveri]|nr:unnamed protein product [Brucella canis str. Oliveri]
MWTEYRTSYYFLILKAVAGAQTVPTGTEVIGNDRQEYCAGRREFFPYKTAYKSWK